jgi:hypothetical protein
MIRNLFISPFNRILSTFTFINIILIGINLSILLASIHLRLSYMTDFNNLYTAVTMIKEGEGKNLYDIDIQTRY